MKVHNGASTGLAALKQTASELVKESADLQHSLDGTMDKFDTVQRQAGEIELEVTENVSNRLWACFCQQDSAVHVMTQVCSLSSTFTKLQTC